MATTRLVRAATAVGAVALSTVGGGVVGTSPWAPKLVALVAASSALLLLPLPLLVSVAVVTTFATRISVSLSSIDLRPEHLVTFALVARVLFGRGIRLTPRQFRAVCAMAGFLFLNVVATALQAPSPAASAPVIGWIALDVILLIGVCGIPEYRDRILRVGIATSTIAGMLAVTVWWLATFGSLRIGVQPDPEYGGYAAYVFSYEANTLGSSLAIWAVIGALVGWPSQRMQWVVQLVALAGILATHTRAALIGYMSAMFLIVLWRRRVSLAVVVGVGATAAVVLFVPAVAPTPPKDVTSKFSHSVDFSSGSGLLRLRNWRLAADDIRGFGYIVGLGTNTYGQRHVEVARGVPVPGYLGNLPLQVFYDVGVIGVLLICAVAISVRRATSRLSWTALALVYVVCSIATSIFWFSLTWLLVGTALSRNVTTGEAAVPSPDRPSGLAPSHPST